MSPHATPAPPAHAPGPADLSGHRVALPDGAPAPAGTAPGLPARVHTPEGLWTAAELNALAEAAAATLRAQGVRVLASQLDNGAAWLVADAAAARAGAVHLPLPGFFTPAQRQHALDAAGADALWLARAPQAPLSGWQTLPLALPPIGPAPLPAVGLHRPARAVAMPPGTGLLTFTSGTTGTPKGVCLGRDRLDAVARGLARATAALPLDRHLAVLPLAVLLEQVAGVLAPAARGAELVLLPLDSLGWQGSSRFDPSALQAAVTAWRPASLILLPQMLRAWTHWLAAAGQRAPDSLRLVAVGGAAVGAATVRRARALGLPVVEGYGLSEAGSVQTLNLPGGQALGSVGPALPQARLRIAPDGEVLVAGSAMLGYVGETTARPADAWWPTGDLGRLDATGRLWLQGRKKQVLITAYGRNVSPEWVEGALMEAGPADAPVLAQAVVLGEGQPALSAVLWPRPGVSPAALTAAVAQANAGLPDYARIARWVAADLPFSPASGLATDNGRPRRAAIAAHFAAALGLPADAGVAGAVTDPTAPRALGAGCPV